MLAFLGTLFLGVELGLGIAVGISLLLVIFESAYPHTAILGRLPGTTEYRNIKNYPQAERYDGIVVVRIDAPIYFANTQNIRDKVRKYETNAKREIMKKRQSNNDNNNHNNDVFASTIAVAPGSDTSVNQSQSQNFDQNQSQTEVEAVRFIIIEFVFDQS